MQHLSETLTITAESAKDAEGQTVLTSASSASSAVTSPPFLKLALGLAVLAALVGTVRLSADWPQLLGPTRNGVYSGPPLADSWPAGGPRVVWRKQVGQGFAGPAVAGGRMILFHRIGREEIVESLDAATGASQWRHAYPTTYRDDFGFDEGPRAVPVVAGGRVFTFGAEGVLSALDLANGRQIWSVDTKRRFSVPKGFFGQAGSPLVEGGRVIANVGGSDSGKSAGIVSFSAETGAVQWTATNHEASYSSPVSATLGGKQVVLFFTRQALVGLDPATGTPLFQRTWRSRSQASVNAASPVIVNDLIFISATYETGATVLRVTGSTLEPLWASDEALSNHYATSVHHDGHLYGFHGRQEFGQALRAVELGTGKVKWSEERFGAGTVLLAGNRLLVLRENGELILAAASPDAFRPVARAQVLQGVVRAYPALSDGFLYARNSADALVCLDLRATKR
jgi:outer membrane protein assembly factor BamB